MRKSIKNITKLEVVKKSVATIERETAEKWAERALDCYKEYGPKKVGWLIRGDHYADEALEHGALVRDSGKTAKRLQGVLDRARETARKRVQKRGRVCVCP